MQRSPLGPFGVSFAFTHTQILRVAAYSSAVNRPLHVPLSTSNSASSPDQHEALVAASSIQHFHDKLLLIKDRLKASFGNLFASPRDGRA